MTPEKAEALYANLEAISAILYEETPSENLRTLEEIEQTVRQKVLKHLFAQKLMFFYPSSHRYNQGQKKTIKKQYWHP